MNYLNVNLLPGAKFEMGREEDAGYDLYSMIDANLLPCSSLLIPVGIKTEFPKEWVGLVLDRSSMGIKGIMRQAGVIDSGFRGEWQVKLYNSSPTPVKIESVVKNKEAKAIAQVVFVQRGKVKPVFWQELGSSDRGEGMNGSTDVRN